MTVDRPFTPGWLAPHVTGLTKGQAVARRCATCGHVSLPPLRICPQGHTTGAWETLPNRAEILFRTTGTDGDFALVRFAGCDTLTLARLALSAGATVGALRPTDTVPPALTLFPEATP